MEIIDTTNYSLEKEVTGIVITLNEILYLQVYIEGIGNCLFSFPEIHSKLGTDLSQKQSGVSAIVAISNCILGFKEGAKNCGFVMNVL